MVAVEALSTFHTVLAARRERYNQQFRLARHHTKGLDPQEFLAHLRDVVGPIVDAVRHDPEPVCDALVELSLALAARGRLGSSGAVADGLRRFLPAVPGLVAAEPRRLPAAVVNALHHLDVSPTGDPGGWLDTMLELSRHTANVSELLDAGAVAAWRRGLAQLRTSALATAARLPAPLVRIALGTSSTVDLARLAEDPWLDPALTGRDSRVLVPARRVGGFRGFGGTFRRPPTVSTSDGRWYATDGEDAWRVFADRFGVSLGRVAAPPAEPGDAGPLVLEAGGVVVDTATGTSLELPELADATSWASAGGTLAATTPWTHGILFVARTVG
ncbi:serine/threonine-protein kinase [Actinophytocola sp. KF-1]